MKNMELPKEFNEVFGTLSKVAGLEKCYKAQNEHKPLKCEKVKIGSLYMCRIHGVLFK